MTDVDREVIFSRSAPWWPAVVRMGGILHLELVAGADANHDPRVFLVPITPEHADVIEHDLPRHLVLWAALLPLGDDAGIDGALDQDAAAARLDPVLFGAPHEVDALLRTIPWYDTRLVGYGANIALLERGEVLASLRHATAELQSGREATYRAERDRKRQNIHLTELDAALLRYTGRYVYGAVIPTRRPQDVDPALLPRVLEVVGTAERAADGITLPGEYSAAHREAWRRLEDAVDGAVRATHPELSEHAMRTVSFLMGAEAAARARAAQGPESG